MFTLVTMCINCCDSDSDISDSERTTPLLSRSSPSYSTMPYKVYGKTKGNKAAAATIFGRNSPQTSHTDSGRNSLSDVTSQLAKLNVLQDVENTKHAPYCSDNHQSLRLAQLGSLSRQHDRDYRIDALEPSLNYDSDNTAGMSVAPPDDSENQRPFLSRDDIVLQPLTMTYKADRGKDLPITAWQDLIPEGAELVKIAEASFAEVYRVSINGQSSILKLMQLKVPSDESSLTARTAIEVNTVVSEVRLMNALTESPGFVTFKEAHLVRGKPCSAIIRAYCACRKWSPTNGTSMFPNPDFFSLTALFLVIELGDAGTVLEDIPLQNIHQVWDVFLGVVVSLGIAENWLHFEHRDLHENNVCITLGKPTAMSNRERNEKYGLSGFETTIIDYGLSRATLRNGDKVFNDLENDLAIFHGSPGYSQFDTYRRMRSHLFTGRRNMFAKSWHTEESKKLSNGHTWEEFCPYSNVLWIKYLLGYVKMNFRDSGGDAEELRQFEVATKDLKRRLDPRTLVTNGGFSSANDICEYIGKEGWISIEQVAAIADRSISPNE